MFVSNYDDAAVEPSEEETCERLTQFNATELLAMTVGLDRGVALPMAASTGQTFDFSDIQKKRLLVQEKHKKRWQRRQARNQGFTQLGQSQTQGDRDHLWCRCAPRRDTRPVTRWPKIPNSSCSYSKP